MPNGRVVRQDDATFERMTMEARSKSLDEDMVKALTADDAVMASGALPQLKTATEAGAKALHQALDDESRAIIKAPKRKEKKPEAEEIKAKTPLDFASEKMAACLDQVSKARAKSLQLTGVEFGQELSKQLLEHATAMEKLWKTLHSMVSKEEKEDKLILAVTADEVVGKSFGFCEWDHWKEGQQGQERKDKKGEEVEFSFSRLANPSQLLRRLRTWGLHAETRALGSVRHEKRREDLFTCHECRVAVWRG